MKLKEINEFSHYQRIVDSYKRKGYLTNDYLYNEVRELISQRHSMRKQSKYEGTEKSNSNLRTDFPNSEKHRIGLHLLTH